jgi:type I restriction enzyme M protein
LTLTFFARAENVGRKLNGDDDILYGRDGQARLNSDLPEILAALRAFQSEQIDLASSLFYTADVLANLVGNENGFRLDFPYHHPSRLEAKRRIEACAYPHVALQEVCAERKDSVVPAQDLAGSSILYTGLAHIESETGRAEQAQTPADSLKSAVKRYERGDILFAKMRPNLRKVALMHFDEPGFTSPECAVLAVRRTADDKPAIDPVLLSILLRSDFVFGQIMHLVAGIGRPRIGSGELLAVRIPVPPPDEQRTIIEAFCSASESATRLEEEGLALQRQARAALTTAVATVADSFARRKQN